MILVFKTWFPLNADVEDRWRVLSTQPTVFNDYLTNMAIPGEPLHADEIAEFVRAMHTIMNFVLVKQTQYRTRWTQLCGEDILASVGNLDERRSGVIWQTYGQPEPIMLPQDRLDFGVGFLHSRLMVRLCEVAVKQTGLGSTLHVSESFFQILPLRKQTNEPTVADIEMKMDNLQL